MSDYFSSPQDIVPVTRALSESVNNLDAAIVVAFDKLPTEANLKRGTVNYIADTGTANAYLVALPHTPSGYVDGLLIVFKAVNANTGASTVNVSSLGVKSLRRQNGDALVAGDLVANKIYAFRYNSTSGYFELQSIAAGSMTDVATVSGIAANVTTVAGISANVTTVAGISANVTTVAGVAASVTTVAGIQASVTTVAGIQADVTAVAADATDIGTVAAANTAIGTVATNIASVNTVSGIQANVTTVAGISANVTTVAGVSANVTTVAGISANVTTVAGVSANVTTVATDIANVNTVATNIANVNAVGADLLEPTSEINTVATDIANVNTVGAAIANVNTVAGISANVTTVAGISADTTTVAGISANVTTVAGNSTNINTVAGVSADVSAVAAQFIGWNFSTTTAMADPGSGIMRLNNAALASVTAIAFDDNNSAAADVSAYVLTWDDSTSAVKGTLTIRQGTANFAVFDVTGLTDNAGWTQVTVAHVTSSGTFTNAVLTFVDFDRTGNVGAGIAEQAVGFTLTGGTTSKTLTVALDAEVAGTNTGDNATNSSSAPAAANPIGLQTCWIPAGAMVARTTNGAASGTVEMATTYNMFKTLDFDAATAEYAQFCIQMPKSWNEGTVTFVPVWSHAATTTNFGVAWFLQGVAISNDDTGAVAFGTAQSSVDTGGTTNDIYVGPASSAITIAGTPAANDYVMFQVYRDVADGGDTMAIDARLHGIQLYYTTDAATDS